MTEKELHKEIMKHFYAFYGKVYEDGEEGQEEQKQVTDFSKY